MGRGARDTKFRHVITVTHRWSDAMEMVPAGERLTEQAARQLVTMVPSTQRPDTKPHELYQRPHPDWEWHMTYIESVETVGNVCTIIVVEPGLD